MSKPSAKSSSSAQLSRGWLAAILVAAATASATPPNYSTFEREQRVDYQPRQEDLLRIWMVYVNQGDGLLLQLPTKYRATGANGHEQIEVLIDGGSNPVGDAGRIARFLEALYSEGPPSIEYAVISHHDQDHVAGLTGLLKAGGTFRTVYHNGLASYRAGVRNFPASGKPGAAAVFSYDSDDQMVQRGMAFLVSGKKTLESSYYVPDLAALLERHQQREFQGVYERLAAGVVTAQSTGCIETFDRAFVGAPFINEAQSARGAPLDGLTFDVLWPLGDLEAYGAGDGDWGETINGNSVTFKLVYGDFEMLFTGDHNEKSEERWLAHLRSVGKLDSLGCDVLKVPHHGSSHALEGFFTHEKLAPVVSVASMGNEGFKSKAMNKRAWQHPSTDVIRWLGGAHRFYSTFIHERKFRWEDITTEAERAEMIELSHILIETDGVWFRVVEIPVDASDLTDVPDVAQVRRSDGTQWIRARR